jgi:hypothetical protein
MAHKAEGPTPMQRRRSEERLALGIVFGVVGAVGAAMVFIGAAQQAIGMFAPPPKALPVLPQVMINQTSDIEAAKAEAMDAAQRADQAAANAEAIVAQARSVANAALLGLSDGRVFRGSAIGESADGLGVASGGGRFQAGYFIAGALTGDGAACVRADCAGPSYFGSFRNGAATGIGRLRFPDGAIYRGEVRGGVPHGFGEYRAANGDVFVGAFNEGARAGHGALTPAGGGPEQAGFWRNGEMIEAVSGPAG